MIGEDGPRLQIGLGKVDITPPLGVELCGYGYDLGRRATEIMDPLYVRAVALRNDAKTLLIINCDLIGLDFSVVDFLKTAFRQKAGMKPEDVLILSTHTHSGPATGILRGCGEVDPEYIEFAKAQIMKAGLDALSDRVDVGALSHFAGQVDGIAWNRVFGDDGPVDRGVYGLLFQ